MARDRIILERRFVPEGSLIIKEGDEGYSAYLIQSGEVDVYSKNEEGNKIALAKLGVGEICGEMALLGDGVRSASVCAVSDCNLVVITRAAFEEKLKRSDTTVRAVMKMLIQRIISSNEERRSHIDQEKEGDSDKDVEEKGSTKGKTSDIFWDF
ncbi:MAG: cyclic nucleotide-binding domain-containing protein [Alphaproteobacteria bacterium]|nr:cyclic nucleotide-binding domain-containing protein [Alphaproteobacteria bacterium]